MYFTYNIEQNDKMNYARSVTHSQQKFTYRLTYVLINISIMLTFFSTLFYFLPKVTLIYNLAIPAKIDCYIFLTSTLLIVLLLLLIWHFKKHFKYLYQLALSQLNYHAVEIWADADSIIYSIDQQQHHLTWDEIDIYQTNKQFLTLQPKNSTQNHLLIIPQALLQSSPLQSALLPQQLA